MNETYGHRAHLASTWQALGKVLVRCWHTLSCSMSLLRVWQEYGKEQARSRQGAGKSMLRVCLGHAGRIQAEFWENSRRIQGEFRLNSQRMHLLRFVACLILIVVGVGEMWGQETPDYSGIYYLANDNLKNNQYDYKGYDNASNFYLCPAQEYYYGSTTYTPANEKPFLTTNKTRQTDESLWIVEKVTKTGYTNYYTIKQKVGDNFWFITVNDEIEGINKSHRRRVHLEKLESDDLTDRNYFTIEPITTQDGIKGYTIGCVDSYKTGDYKYLNPAGGNYAQYTANGSDHGGIVGFYKKGEIGADASGSIWFFEVPKPIIQIDENNKLTFTCANANVTFHYTIDGGDPSATGTNDVYNATDDITLTEGVHTIKAIAVMNNGNAGYASGVVTQEVTVFSTEHPYLISNNQNPWTIGSETKNIFYLIPSDVSSGNTTVNTTSMPRPTMEWNIRYTGEADGELYLNIINAKTGDYLYRTNNNSIFMKTSSEKTTLEKEDDNGFKFYLIKRTDGYSIVPYGVNNKYLNKNSGNTDKNAVNLSGTDNEYSQWNFVTKDAVLNDDILPFTSSDANTAVYYKIQNGNGDNYFIIPPTTTNYATASDATDDATVKKMSWCFVKVEDPNDDDWLTYYKVVNAETGKALHYTRITNTSLNVGSYDDEDDNYKFAFVKSPTSNYYYIVPKAIKDAQLAQISMIWRDSNALKKGATRGVSNNIWTFTPADLFCNTPIFEEEAGSITISCVPDITRIYYTTDGTDPDPTNENQRYVSTIPLSTTNQLCIKAISYVSNETTNVSSNVVTLLNKPNVTVADGTYTYKGTAWEPAVTVSIDETTAPTTATYTVEYSNNTNVGTASVTVTDEDANDNWYIWNVPDAHFTITPKAVTITAGSDSKTYNGQALTKSDYTKTDLETGDTHTFTVTMTEGSTITNVGTQPNVIATVDGTAVTTGTPTAVGNYTVTTANGTLTVNPKAVTITANDASKEYDGTALTESGFTTSALEAGDTHTFTVVMTAGSTITDVSSTPNVIATVDGIEMTTGTQIAVGNYLVTTANGTLTVGKKSIGQGALAAGFTISFDEDNNIILKDGDIPLYEDTDFDVGDDTTVGKYTSREIRGIGNYTGYFAFRNASVSFQTDANELEWSATFVAEPIGGGDADDTKGHALPDGMKAFIITDIDGDWAIPEQLTYIPEGVPVLLVSDKESGGFIVEDATPTDEQKIKGTQKEANMLKVTTSTTHFDIKTIFLLYKNEFIYNMSGDLAAGKVYLNPPSGSSPAPSRLRIKKKDDTGIEDTHFLPLTSHLSDVWYTLDGRRLNGKPMERGLYINEGKKIFIK